MNVLQRLKQKLNKTRAHFVAPFVNLFLGKKEIDAELFAALEAHLLNADVGVDITEDILAKLTQKLARKELHDSEGVKLALKNYLMDVLMPVEQPLLEEKIATHHPFVILMVGVNGAGKTTTIAKLAKQWKAQGKSILLAAGDTFRAAAIEQLQIWGERHHVPVIAQHTGADSAAVIFDAVQSAKARGIDIVIADTAGRLHTQQNLMEELKKINRVIKKIDSNAPHETLLVLDAGIGQNAIKQAMQFHQAIGVTGIVMTKLDGTAKGGIVFALAKALALPIRYIGMGETAEDLRVFDRTLFVDALFS